MKAMILAAGLGTRMRPLTDKCPKPLLKVNGKTLIERHIERLSACGFHELVINVSYCAEQIEAYLGNGANWGVEIQYSREAQPLETGGGIYQALPMLCEQEDEFLVVNGDIWSDFDYRNLAPLGNDLARLLLVANPPQHPEGDFYLYDGRVLDEKATEPRQDVPRYTFSGISRLSARLFAEAKAGLKAQGGVESGAFPLAPLLRQAIGKGRVAASLHSGRWIDVGTPERLQNLELELKTANAG